MHVTNSQTCKLTTCTLTKQSKSVKVSGPSSPWGGGAGLRPVRHPLAWLCQLSMQRGSIGASGGSIPPDESLRQVVVTKTEPCEEQVTWIYVYFKPAAVGRCACKGCSYPCGFAVVGRCACKGGAHPTRAPARVGQNRKKCRSCVQTELRNGQ